MTTIMLRSSAAKLLTRRRDGGRNVQWYTHFRRHAFSNFGIYLIFVKHRVMMTRKEGSHIAGRMCDSFEEMFPYLHQSINKCCSIAHGKLLHIWVRRGLIPNLLPSCHRNRLYLTERERGAAEPLSIPLWDPPRFSRLNAALRRRETPIYGWSRNIYHSSRLEN